MEILPHGKTIIFDYEASGPYIFQDGRCRHATELYHKLGEADLAILYWCRVFRARSVKICTTDTDFMPIMLQYIMQTGSSHLNPFIVWVYERDSFVNMKSMYDLMWDPSGTCGLSPQSFVLLCIASGNDYFIKNQYCFHGLGLDYIVGGIQRLEEESTCSALFGEEGELKETGVDRFVRMVFTQKLDGGGGKAKKGKSKVDDVLVTATRKRKMKEEAAREEGEPERLTKKRKKDNQNENEEGSNKKVEASFCSAWNLERIGDRLSKQKTVNTPTPDAIKAAYECLNWNMDYWMASWTRWAVDASFREAEPTAFA